MVSLAVLYKYCIFETLIKKQHVFLSSIIIHNFKCDLLSLQKSGSSSPLCVNCWCTFFDTQKSNVNSLYGPQFTYVQKWNGKYFFAPPSQAYLSLKFTPKFRWEVKIGNKLAEGSVLPCTSHFTISLARYFFLSLIADLH
jgi:hypothetical protein